MTYRFVCFRDALEVFLFPAPCFSYDLKTSKVICSILCSVAAECILATYVAITCYWCDVSKCCPCFSYEQQYFRRDTHALRVCVQSSCLSNRKSCFLFLYTLVCAFLFSYSSAELISTSMCEFSQLNLRMSL